MIAQPLQSAACRLKAPEPTGHDPQVVWRSGIWWRWDGSFHKKIIWAIMNEKAHLFSPVFGARAEGNTTKAKGPLGSHRTARNIALGHSRVLWATAELGMH